MINIFSDSEEEQWGIITEHNCREGHQKPPYKDYGQVLG